MNAHVPKTHLQQLTMFRHDKHLKVLYNWEVKELQLKWTDIFLLKKIQIIQKCVKNKQNTHISFYFLNKPFNKVAVSVRIYKVKQCCDLMSNR